MRPVAALVGAAVLLFAAVLVSLASGPLSASPMALLATILGQGSPDAATALSLRGPRVLGAILVGGGLAVAGAALQAAFRNPLVAPDLLGVSSGSALGAAIALLVSGVTALVQAAAFGGGLVAAALALGTARAARGRDPRLSLVLCGLVVGALAYAGLALVLHLADPYSQLPAISYWLLGSLARASTGEVAGAAIPAAVGLAMLVALRSRLDALTMGDEQARALGLDVRTARMVVVVGATLMTSAAVSIAGIVGWIGLLAPHAARLLVGSEARRLLPLSGVLGAAFAVMVDLLARSFDDIEIPLGLLTAAIGAPAFLALFVALGRRT